MNIYILEGTDEISFGMPMSEFLEKMGTPDQQETVSEPEDVIKTELLNYSNIKTSFFFEGKGDKYYLSSIDTENPEAKIVGKEVFNMNVKELAELFKNIGFDEYETEMEPFGEMRLTFDDAMIDFYFVDRKVSSIIWGY